MNMVKTIMMLFALVASLLIAGCDSGDGSKEAGGATGALTLEYDFGESTSEYNNIYVIWAENGSEDFYCPVYICGRLLDGSLTNTALPYWKVNIYPHMTGADVDAVTGATVQQSDLSIPFSLPEGAPRQFTINFETDVSFNANDWFDDQPAILYRADVDLDAAGTEYALDFVGWTPNEGTAGAVAGTDTGELQTETRYITNHEGDGGGFGDYDPLSQTVLVGSNGIRLVIGR